MRARRCWRYARPAPRRRARAGPPLRSAQRALVVGLDVLKLRNAPATRPSSARRAAAPFAALAAAPCIVSCLQALRQLGQSAGCAAAARTRRLRLLPRGTRSGDAAGCELQRSEFSANKRQTSLSSHKRARRPATVRRSACAAAAPAAAMLRCSFVGAPLAAPLAAPSPARRARCVAPRAAKGKGGGGKADKGAKKARSVLRFPFAAATDARPTTRLRLLRQRRPSRRLMGAWR